MDPENVLPNAEAQAEAVAGEQQNQADALADPAADDGGEKTEGEAKEAKPEKTP